MSDSYKIFVMTPMCLVEAVKHKELKLTDFSMLVLDECHHAALGKHAYKLLMDLYLDVKHDPDSSQASHLPQVSPSTPLLLLSWYTQADRSSNHYSFLTLVTSYDVQGEVLSICYIYVTGRPARILTKFEHF